MVPYSQITELFVNQKAPGDGGTERVAGENGGPFPSIEAALNYVRELRRIGVGQPISIRLAAGLYELGSTIRIDNGVSGITIEPAENAEVRLIGGREITGFVWDEFNGKRCLSAPIEGECDFTDFFVNGIRAKLTRYPAEGWFYADDVENKDGNLFSPSSWFIAQEGDIKDFRNIDRVQLSFCHYWIDEHTPIKSYDLETRKVELEYPSRFGIAGGKGTASGLEYCLENVAEAFANANEWYAENGRIYYIPRDDSITPETIKAYAPKLKKLFEIHGTPGAPVKNIRFRGISMGVTKGEYASMGAPGKEGLGPVGYASDAQAVSEAHGSIEFRYAANCSIEDCELTNFGVHGITILSGCHGIKVQRTKLYDGGAGGVKIYGGAVGCPDSELTYGNTVEDCSITYCGRRYFAACGVLLIHTYENVIAHNEIAYLYYTGVSVGWIWGYTPNQSHDNIITKNRIHNLGAGLLSDMGGVYLLGMQPGTVVSNNIIYEVRSRHYGGWALYTDEGSSFMTIENNICWGCTDNCYHQHYGSMNTVRNNIFAFSDQQMIRVTRSEAHLSIIFENNIIYSNGVPVYDISKEHIANRTVCTRRNLIFDRTKDAPVIRKFWDCELSLADAQTKGLDYGSVVADPKFADPDNFDFTLAPDSPAWEMGFLPIDTSDVGPRV